MHLRKPINVLQLRSKRGYSVFNAMRGEKKRIVVSLFSKERYQ